ncbi:aldo/keto reductase [Nonomuraea recticatena]|uniref:aldo/keto reductase n=1 Tax=Nonomuraea recticatena TaxID=46178 RepID=UPI003620B158
MRTLGKLTVPPIGYGAMVLSPGIYGEIDDDWALAALRHALDEGATHIDTSDAYGPDGHNERLVGRAIRGRRDEVVVATKFGLAVPEGWRPGPSPWGTPSASCAAAPTPPWCAVTPSAACATSAPT